MLKNHVRIFIRHIKRHKLYAFINISGLAVGMAACILILLFIQSEVSYENMHGKADRVYRALTIDKALGTNNQRVGVIRSMKVTTSRVFDYDYLSSSKPARRTQPMP